ncbi:unnamed protein product, partial [Didymodactylos carnosus]
GEDQKKGYVADEIITTRAGARIRVGNTDAEGRMAIVDNGPAKRDNISKRFQEAGDLIGDPFEISTVRKEDFDFIKDKGEVADILQCNNSASSATSRGHQFPVAFLIQVSGLDKHGSDSDQPLR